MEYAKPWLSIEDQIEGLSRRGLEVGDRREAGAILRNVGYYRLTGYLYPFRQSERYVDDDGRKRTRILSSYEPGVRMDDAAQLIDFDRELRMLVLEGVERIEIALRMQLGYSLGQRSAFAHEDASAFLSAFTDPQMGEDGEPAPSRHEAWLERVRQRQNNSDEAFVAHFRHKYDDRMPIWALTEILELGHTSRLYGGLRNDIATEIAGAFGVPTKQLMQSWIATINYVRNVAAHHSRLYNRKLVSALKRPKGNTVPLLAHLTQEEAPKQFGTYSALAVMAYVLETVHPGRDWAVRVAALLRNFPTTARLNVGSMGVAAGWIEQDLWKERA
ncbi:Abi family protein [Clavibacter sepedonicus]|uniref:Phage resistance protein n=1 Tax=Clavibacter sepedonicus TaxID=31964 RepID=B0REE3_CLASE|nr:MULTISPECIES: Abi family protein [Clavibacter]MBD5381371.1 Abi family protein [Clavibacter sp.]OQJ47671.1 abortive phage infection protein [Clavibacter sepedonicus]OQJ53228.1 abortive phage infection protein [Clavibacter sepedonicus]UUK64392.1 Abi family protein [Clavibacter sepedonicus]CAQ02035.1 putative phage resistance protein [Clavibacter sepedonicus]